MWKTIFLELPMDQEVVWIRVLNIYGQLGLALWDESLQSFTMQTTGISVPVEMCSRWKSQ